jgi:cap1 methyltransferase
VGMTILDDRHDSDIPGWKRSDAFLASNSGKVFIENGYDGTGNILSTANFVHCCETYGSSMDLITADGGFDFSDNFNDQERVMIPLLYAQICYAVCMQKRGGHFVLKVFDCFRQSTIEMIYLLTSFYRNVYISKPHTSRSGNSEKYIVCKGFIHESNAPFYTHMYRTFMEITTTRLNVERILSIDIPLQFLTKMEEYNAIFGQYQISNIHYTLSLLDRHMKPEKIDSMVKYNVSKCITWCIKHHVPYNNLNANIFVCDHSSSYPKVELSLSF